MWSGHHLPGKQLRQAMGVGPRAVHLGPSSPGCVAVVSSRPKSWPPGALETVPLLSARMVSLSVPLLGVLKYHVSQIILKGGGVKNLNSNEYDSSSLLASLGRSPWLFSSLVAYPEVSHTLCSWEPLAQEVRGGEGGVGDGPGWFSPAKPRHCFSRHPLRPSGPNGNSLGHTEEGEPFVRRRVWWAISVLAPWEQPSEKQHVPNARLFAHLSFRHACVSEHQRKTNAQHRSAPSGHATPTHGFACCAGPARGLTALVGTGLALAASSPRCPGRPSGML